MPLPHRTQPTPRLSASRSLYTRGLMPWLYRLSGCQHTTTLITTLYTRGLMPWLYRLYGCQHTTNTHHNTVHQRPHALVVQTVWLSTHHQHSSQHCTPEASCLGCTDCLAVNTPQHSSQHCTPEASCLGCTDCLAVNTPPTLITTLYTRGLMPWLYRLSGCQHTTTLITTLYTRGLMPWLYRLSGCQHTTNTHHNTVHQRPHALVVQTVWLSTHHQHSSQHCTPEASCLGCTDCLAVNTPPTLITTLYTRGLMPWLYRLSGCQHTTNTHHNTVPQRPHALVVQTVWLSTHHQHSSQHCTPEASCLGCTDCLAVNTPPTLITTLYTRGLMPWLYRLSGCQHTTNTHHNTVHQRPHALVVQTVWLSTHHQHSSQHCTPEASCLGCTDCLAVNTPQHSSQHCTPEASCLGCTDCLAVNTPPTLITTLYTRGLMPWLYRLSGCQHTTTLITTLYTRGLMPWLYRLSGCQHTTNTHHNTVHQRPHALVVQTVWLSTHHQHSSQHCTPEASCLGCTDCLAVNTPPTLITTLYTRGLMPWLYRLSGCQHTTNTHHNTVPQRPHALVVQTVWLSTHHQHSSQHCTPEASCLGCTDCLAVNTPPTLITTLYTRGLMPWLYRLSGCQHTTNTHHNTVHQRPHALVVQTVWLATHHQHSSQHCTPEASCLGCTGCLAVNTPPTLITTLYTRGLMPWLYRLSGCQHTTTLITTLYTRGLMPWLYRLSGCQHTTNTHHNTVHQRPHALVVQTVWLSTHHQHSSQHCTPEASCLGCTDCLAVNTPPTLITTLYTRGLMPWLYRLSGCQHTTNTHHNTVHQRPHALVVQAVWLSTHHQHSSQHCTPEASCLGCTGCLAVNTPPTLITTLYTRGLMPWLYRLSGCQHTTNTHHNTVHQRPHALVVQAVWLSTHHQHSSQHCTPEASCLGCTDCLAVNTPQHSSQHCTPEASCLGCTDCLAANTPPTPITTLYTRGLMPWLYRLSGCQHTTNTHHNTAHQRPHALVVQTVWLSTHHQHSSQHCTPEASCLGCTGCLAVNTPPTLITTLYTRGLMPWLYRLSGCQHTTTLITTLYTRGLMPWLYRLSGCQHTTNTHHNTVHQRPHALVVQTIWLSTHHQHSSQHCTPEASCLGCTDYMAVKHTTNTHHNTVHQRPHALVVQTVWLSTHHNTHHNTVHQRPHALLVQTIWLSNTPPTLITTLYTRGLMPWLYRLSGCQTHHQHSSQHCTPEASCLGCTGCLAVNTPPTLITTLYTRGLMHWLYRLSGWQHTTNTHHNTVHQWPHALVVQTVWLSTHHNTHHNTVHQRPHALVVQAVWLSTHHQHSSQHCTPEASCLGCTGCLAVNTPPTLITTLYTRGLMPWLYRLSGCQHTTTLITTLYTRGLMPWLYRLSGCQHTTTLITTLYTRGLMPWLYRLSGCQHTTNTHHNTVHQRPHALVVQTVWLSTHHNTHHNTVHQRPHALVVQTVWLATHHQHSSQHCTPEASCLGCTGCLAVNTPPTLITTLYTRGLMPWLYRLSGCQHTTNTHHNTVHQRPHALVVQTIWLSTHHQHSSQHCTPEASCLGCTDCLAVNTPPTLITTLYTRGLMPWLYRLSGWQHTTNTRHNTVHQRPHALVVQAVWLSTHHQHSSQHYTPEASCLGCTDCLAVNTPQHSSQHCTPEASCLGCTDCLAGNTPPTLITTLYTRGLMPWLYRLSGCQHTTNTHHNTVHQRPHALVVQAVWLATHHQHSSQHCTPEASCLGCTDYLAVNTPPTLITTLYTRGLMPWLYRLSGCQHTTTLITTLYTRGLMPWLYRLYGWQHTTNTHHNTVHQMPHALVVQTVWLATHHQHSSQHCTPEASCLGCTDCLTLARFSAVSNKAP